MNICKTAWKFILWILFLYHLNFNPFGNWDFCTLVVKHPLIHISNKKASIFCYLKQLEFFRSYFQRRVRDGFKESMSLSEGPQIQEQLKIAQQNLQMIQRQVWIFVCYSLFILYQVNIFCHQLIQNMTTDFVTFTKIYTNCIQNLHFFFFWISTKNQSLYFGLIGDKICCSDKVQHLFELPYARHHRSLLNT